MPASSLVTTWVKLPYSVARVRAPLAGLSLNFPLPFTASNAVSDRVKASSAFLSRINSMFVTDAFVDCAVAATPSLFVSRFARPAP